MTFFGAAAAVYPRMVMVGSSVLFAATHHLSSCHTMSS